MLKVTHMDLQEVLVLEYGSNTDNRGSSHLLYSRKELEAAGMGTEFAEEILYRAAEKGTLYGIHFQNHPRAQTKLLTCTKGQGMDYAIDLRRDSKTYKLWASTELSAQNGKQMYIPAGFGHAFLSLEDDTHILMRIDQSFDPALARAISHQDAAIGIRLPIPVSVLSDMDRNAPALADSDSNL